MADDPDTGQLPLVPGTRTAAEVADAEPDTVVIPVDDGGGDDGDTGDPVDGGESREDVAATAVGAGVAVSTDPHADRPTLQQIAIIIVSRVINVHDLCAP